MPKIILIIVTLVLIWVLGYFYTQSTKKQSKYRVNVQKIDAMPSHIRKQEKPRLAMKEIQTSKHTLSPKEIPVEDSAEHASETLLYKSLSIEEAKLTTPARKNVVPIGAMRITQRMATLHPNDTLTLSDIEGEDYTLSVQSIRQNDDGSTSTTASYEDEGMTYTTTITQSEKSTYITLSTANGLYEIETGADTGYIYRTDSIRKALQSRTPNDVIILPIPKTQIRQ